MTSVDARPAPARWVRGITLIGAAGFLVFGLWALVSPQGFFDTLATFEPYNRHLLHDLGAFQLGLGAVLALAAFPERVDGLVVLLLVAGAARWSGTRPG